MTAATARTQVLAAFAAALEKLSDDDLETLADADDLSEILETLLEIRLADLAGVVVVGAL